MKNILKKIFLKIQYYITPRKTVVQYIHSFFNLIKNFLKLNQIAHKVSTQENVIKQLLEKIEQQNEQIQNQNEKINDFQNSMKNGISKEMLSQSFLFQQRIDQFITNMNVKLENDVNLHSKVEVLEKLPKSFIDDYYLSFVY